MSNKNKILKPGYNCLGFAQSGVNGVIIDADSYYRAFYDAARLANKTIMISGWQFDSDVKIIRGALGEITFVNLLKELCEVNPELRIYMLAWDFSFIYLFSRQWRQRRRFDSAHPRISFRFDNTHAIVASHHQKYVVIDSAAAFVGGMDFCERRWDTPAHLVKNPLRTDSRGNEYEPYHDVQSYVEGQAASMIAGLFVERWKKVTGEEINLSAPSSTTDMARAKTDIPIPAARVALSRTEPRAIRGRKKPIKEIKRLYMDAIIAAEKLIYIENQYFTSFAVYRALLRKIRSSPPGLNIIIVLPKKEQTALERVYVGLSQQRILNSLVRSAKRHKHLIGIYHPIAILNGREAQIFVHSKLLAIDDKFLSIGSANTSNRSMGLDSELNFSWEASSKNDRKFFGAIDAIRTRLLAEHAGLETAEDAQSLSGMTNLVDRLNALSGLPEGRLRLHKSMKASWFSRLLMRLKLDRIIIDPENAVIDDNIQGAVSAYRRSLPMRAAHFIIRTLGFSRERRKR